MSRKGRRRIVVGGRVFWWSYRYYEGFHVAADDRRLWGMEAEGGVRVGGPDFAGLPAGMDTPALVENDVPLDGNVTPAYIRSVIEWCLDARAPKRARAATRRTPEPSPSDTDFLQPRRPMVSRALAHARALSGAPDGSSVLAVPGDPARARPKRRGAIDAMWESLALAGHLPLPWCAEGERWFVIERSSLCDLDAPRIEPRSHADVALLTRPATMRSAVLIADVAEDMARAESLAREFCGRARRFGVPSPERVAWWIEGDVHAAPWTHPRPALRVFDAVQDCLRERGLDALEMPATERQPRAGSIRRAWEDDRALAATGCWAAAVRESLRAPDGRGFDESADPLAPLLAMWETGYGLLSVDDDAIWLYARL